MPDIAFDIRQGNGVFLTAKTDGIALGAGACGAADAMHVILGLMR